MQADTSGEAKIKCPKCGHAQPKSDSCAKCSIIFEKYYLSIKKAAEKERLAKEKKIQEERSAEEKKIKEANAIMAFQPASIGEGIDEKMALQAVTKSLSPDDNLLGVFKVSIDPKNFGNSGFLPVSIYLLATEQRIVLWDYKGSNQLANVGYLKIKTLEISKALVSKDFILNLEDGKIEFHSIFPPEATVIEDLINQQKEILVGGSKNRGKGQNKGEKNSNGKTKFITGNLTAKKSSGGKFVGFAALAIMIYIPYCAISTILSPSDDTSYDMCDDDVRAFVEANSFVKKRLKSPSTADFPWGSDGRVGKSGDCTFVVRSYVDSQNSFGAMIRTNYVVKLKPISQDQWKLIDLRFY